MEPCIKVAQMSKQYGKHLAVDSISFTVSPGEIFGFLGPNGAGKTTTMEILTGQLIPDHGQVSVRGIDPIERPTAVRESVGILPEKESPPSFLTPREYFEFVGAVRDIPTERIDDRIDEWTNRLGFSAKLDTVSTDLSRGQQQKVMVAAAFLHDPDLVFIDEPLANLDPIIQERVKRYLRDYRADGNSVILTTHDVNVAAELCSRVGIMYGGTLVADIRPADLPADQTLLEAFLEYVGDDAG